MHGLGLRGVHGLGLRGVHGLGLGLGLHQTKHLGKERSPLCLAARSVCLQDQRLQLGQHAALGFQDFKVAQGLGLGACTTLGLHILRVLLGNAASMVDHLAHQGVAVARKGVRKSPPVVTTRADHKLAIRVFGPVQNLLGLLNSLGSHGGCVETPSAEKVDRTSLKKLRTRIPVPQRRACCSQLGVVRRIQHLQRNVQLPKLSTQHVLLRGGGGLVGESQGELVVKCGVHLAVERLHKHCGAGVLFGLHDNEDARIQWSHLELLETHAQSRS